MSQRDSLMCSIGVLLVLNSSNLYPRLDHVPARQQQSMGGCFGLWYVQRAVVLKEGKGVDHRRMINELKQGPQELALSSNLFIPGDVDTLDGMIPSKECPL